MDEVDFRAKCLEKLGQGTEYSLPMLDSFVFATMKAAELERELKGEGAVIEHTNKANATNPASSPKVRMWALYREQANKLGQMLGLIPTAKVGRPAEVKKTGFKLDSKMKVA